MVFVHLSVDRYGFYWQLHVLVLKTDVGFHSLVYSHTCICFCIVLLVVVAVSSFRNFFLTCQICSFIGLSFQVFDAFLMPLLVSFSKFSLCLVVMYHSP